jgi:predicted dithiol-disulfide oxidoreductase (DUF899 family)
MAQAKQEQTKQEQTKQEQTGSKHGRIVSDNAMPNVVPQVECLAAHNTLLTKGKEATRARGRLSAERRRLPMVKIEKAYAFVGPDGKVSLLNLFEGRRQLIV